MVRRVRSVAARCLRHRSIVTERDDLLTLGNELARLELLKVLGLRNLLEEFRDARFAPSLA